MAKLTDAQIAEIQELYKVYGTYSQVAKLTGRSPATVKKYVGGGSAAENVSETSKATPENQIPFSSTILPAEETPFDWENTYEFLQMTLRELEENISFARERG